MMPPEVRREIQRERARLVRMLPRHRQRFDVHAAQDADGDAVLVHRSRAAHRAMSAAR